MSILGSYNVSSFNRDVNQEFRRLQVQAHLTWKRESRVLSWFGLQDGMSLAEFGSGPGLTSELLLSLLPNGSVTAIDLDPVMIRHAKQYQKQQGISEEKLKIIEASVMDTGLPDNSFDFATARAIFEHLNDPVGAAKEIRRVLKPGGKLVVTDIDRDVFWFSDPPMPELKLLMDKLYEVLETRGGNLKIGRELMRILKKAGFQNLDLEAIILHNGDINLGDFFLKDDPESFSRLLVDEGLLTKKYIDDYKRAIDSFQELPDPFFGEVWMMACGKNP